MFAIPLTTYFEPYSYRRVPRTGYSFADPATEARERLVRAVKEQQAAQQAYTDILAQHELAQFGLTDLDAHRPSYSDFALDLSRPTRGRSFYNPPRSIYTPQETQHQHEIAIRAKREELIRQHRLKAALAQEEARHREELQRRQELIEAQRRQQLRRAEIQRRAAAIQQQQQEQAQAIALALAFAQEFFGAQEKETETEAAQPVKTCAGGCRRVRFDGPSKAPGAKATTSTPPAATNSNPDATPAPVASTSYTPVRITIRETKGKASSHVRVNSTHSAASTTPADAHAALAILSSDLDGLVSPTHVWASEAHRRHSLNQLLEQVDAVESGGEESVRDVRRTLVRRVERAIEGLPDEDEVHPKSKGKGIEIREPQPTPVSVTVKDDTATEADVEAPVQAVTAVEVEGYEVPDFPEATPAAATGPANSSTGHEVHVEEPTDEGAPLNVWSSGDLADPVGPTVILNDDVEVHSLHSDDSAQPSSSATSVSQMSQLSEPVTTSDVAADATDSSPNPNNASEVKSKLSTPGQSTKKSTSGNGSDGEEAYELL